MSKLLYDARDVLGDRAGLHALLIGISDYPNLPSDPPELDAGPPDFGLRSLTASASSADRLARWIIENRDRFSLPLATCRLLISPSAAELTADPTLAVRSDLADLAQVQNATKAWRSCAAAHPDGVTFFYFAGHGLQRRYLERATDHVLLLRPFGEDGSTVLQHAFSVQDLIDAMAPGPLLQKIARYQYFLFDACRNAPKAFESYQSTPCSFVLDGFARSPDDNRAIAIFETTESDRRAYAHPNGVTLFTAALLTCLKGGIGERDPVIYSAQPTRWNLTLGALERGIEYYLRAESAACRVSQHAQPTCTMPSSAVFCRLDAPPLLPLTVALDPASARVSTQVRLLDEHDQVAWSLPLPIEPHPCSGPLAAGIYRYHAKGGQSELTSSLFPHDKPGDTVVVKIA